MERKGSLPHSQEPDTVSYLVVLLVYIDIFLRHCVTKDRGLDSRLDGWNFLSNLIPLSPLVACGPLSL
jgi:hypothetical protein